MTEGKARADPISTGAQGTLRDLESERGKVKTSNMGLMNRLVEHVRQAGEGSLRKVEIQLSIRIWKQYVLAEAYRNFFQDVRLERSR